MAEKDWFQPGDNAFYIRCKHSDGGYFFAVVADDMSRLAFTRNAMKATEMSVIDANTVLNVLYHMPPGMRQNLGLRGEWGMVPSSSGAILPPNIVKILGLA